MNPETLQNVICFVADETGVSLSRISAATRILEDLGVDGDDASDLFLAFATRFHVDLTTFQFSLHFGPEAAWSPLNCLYHLFTGQARTVAVTVGQLAEAAERGVWNYTS